MWAALFVVVLILVHIQFKYCAQVGIATLKLAETAILVLVIRAYMESDIVWEHMREWLNWDGTWDTLTEVWDKVNLTRF